MAGVPLLRIRHANIRCLAKVFRAAGALCSKTNSQSPSWNHQDSTISLSREQSQLAGGKRSPPNMATQVHRNGPESAPDFAAFVAIDWGDDKHVWVAQDAQSGIRERGALEARPETVDAWMTAYLARYPGRQIAVALSKSVGALYPSGPRATPKMRTCYWTCSRSIATVCAGSIRTPRRLASSSCWWKSGASWDERTRLVAFFGTDRERYATAGEVACFTGIGPVRERSDQRDWIHFRYACPKFLRQTFHEWASHSIARSVWARAYYDRQRAKGSGHHAAVRALAFKWIRSLFRCWKDRKPYDEQTYIQALRRSASPLATILVNA